MTKIPDIKLPREQRKVGSKSTSTKAKSKTTTKAKPKRKLFNKKVAIALGIVLLVVVVLVALAARSANTMYTKGMAAKGELEAAQSALTEQRFADAQVNFDQTLVHLEATQTASDQLFWLKWLPWVSTQFDAVDHIVAGGIYGVRGAKEIAVVGETVFDAIETEGDSLAEIGPKQRKSILQSITETPDQIRLAQDDLALAVEELEQIEASGLVGPLATVVTPLQEQLPVIDQLVNKALPFLEVAPTILGYPEEQQYLLLLQNNTELRATGGFIGSYGILKVKNGDIKDLFTNNIYNIDYPYRDNPDAQHVSPPEPIKKYLSIYEWYLRDSNWDPHFPKSAEKALEFYYKQGGPEEDLDGVIAIDQSFIKFLLEITGPIVVEGDEYTPENLDDLLHEKVEISFEEDGRTNASRKEVIGNMAGVLMEKVLTLPRDRWPLAVEVILESLDSKHLILYSKDEQSQLLIEQLGWGNAILDGYDGDYLQVVDSNLGALKTDRVMVRNFNYDLRQEGDDYLVDLTLNYENTGVFDFFTSRYNSYTRIYVPKGSELIDSSGFRTHDRNLGGELVQALVTQDENVGKTIFEGFISIEPQTNEDITLTYKLPASIGEQIAAGQYRLYWQKQAGTENVYTHANIDLGTAIDSFTGVDEWEQNGNTILQLSRLQETDNDLTIQFK